MSDDSTAICGDCRQEFLQTKAYVCSRTPGLNPPVGKGCWPATAYCPNCGALIAEDEGFWAWRGASATVNTERPSIPAWIGMEARRIPYGVTPLHEEGRVDIQAVREYELMLKSDPLKDDTEASLKTLREGGQLLSEGNMTGALEKLDVAGSQGLSKVSKANTLGEWGTTVIGDATSNDLERIGEGIRLCELSVKLWKSSSWKAHYVLGLVHKARGNEVAAQAAIANAHRYALTQWWNQSFEWTLNHKVSLWVAGQPH